MTSIPLGNFIESWNKNSLNSIEIKEIFDWKAGSLKNVYDCKWKKNTENENERLQTFNKASNALWVAKERIKEILNEKQRHLKLESQMKYQFRTSNWEYKR